MKKEPARIVGYAVAVIVAAATYFGVEITASQQDALQTLILAAFEFVVAVGGIEYIRSRVFSASTHDAEIQRERMAGRSDGRSSE